MWKQSLQRSSFDCTHDKLAWLAKCHPRASPQVSTVTGYQLLYSPLKTCIGSGVQQGSLLGPFVKPCKPRERVQHRINLPLASSRDRQPRGQSITLLTANKHSIVWRPFKFNDYLLRRSINSVDLKADCYNRFSDDFWISLKIYSRDKFNDWWSCQMRNSVKCS